MIRFRPFALIVAAALATPGAALARRTQEPGDGVPDSIRYYESVAMMSSSRGAAAQAGRASEQADGTAELSFYTLGRQFDLQLEAHAPFAPGAVVHWVDDRGVVDEPADGSGFYRGHVEGDPTSWVRLALRDGAMSGIASTGGELYFFEPASRFFGEDVVGETLAYRLSDTDTAWDPGSCAAHVRSPRARRVMRQGRTAAEALRNVIGSGAFQAAAASTLKRAQLGMVADFEYFGRHGAGSADAIAQLVNNVDGIYQSEIGVTLDLVSTVVFTTSNDPFDDSTNPNTLLNEVATYRNANNKNSSQAMWGTDYTHLITGRDLDGTVIGIAFIGAVCDATSAVGVDQDYTTAVNLLTLLLSHEMGHNFGAFHDAQANNSCPCCASSPATFIMNPVLSGSLQSKFSDCSKSFINPFVNGAGCLDTVPAGSPTPTPTPTPLALNPLPSPIVVGGTLTLTGTGFTAGSMINLFINGNTIMSFGPFKPTTFTSTTLTLNQLDPTIPLGNGFGSVQVVNTDQNFIASNVQSQYVFGKSTLNIPTITGLNNQALRPTDPSVPVATVETAIAKDATLTINGTGFNAPLVNLYTSTGYIGPLSPLGGGTATQIQVQVPGNAPTGPLSVQVVNSPYRGNVVSNAVSAALGATVSISSVVANGATVTVTGTGFSPLSVINLWAKQTGGQTAFLGGYDGSAQPRIPLTLLSDTQFQFTLPSGTASGSAYVQVVNPPFIAFSTSGSTPNGAFMVSLP
jgi:hypothetical protein